MGGKSRAREPKAPQTESDQDDTKVIVIGGRKRCVRLRGRTWSDQTCEHCGLVYSDFRTGYKYTEVRMLLWVADEDYSKWKYKRRHTVLGLWHSIKRSLWDEHIYVCEMAALAVQEARLDQEMVEKLPEERAELDTILASYEQAKADDEIPF